MMPKQILADQFSRVFDGDPAQIVSRAAGRVELIGGHTDYNEGFVIAAAIDSSYYATAARRSDNKVRMYSAWAKEEDTFALECDLKPSARRKWANYGRGVAAMLIEAGCKLVGADIHISGDVPVGAGLSSSAALEVSIANALLTLAGGGEPLAVGALARVCQKAENIYAQSPCGIMDQLVSISGQADHAVFLDCRDISTRAVPLEGENCSILILNSMVRHEVGGGQYGKRRASCEKACGVISGRYPKVKALRDANMEMLGDVKNGMDPQTYRRAAHVIGENARVLEASVALEEGKYGEFGALMFQSHISARDLYEISCPEIDFLVDCVCGQQGCYGARLSGGGFGGAAVSLVRPENAKKIAAAVAREYKEKFGIDCGIHLAKASQGVEVVRL
jgi:galactokinase